MQTLRLKMTVLAGLLAGCGSGGSSSPPEASAYPAVAHQAIACPAQTPNTMVALAFGQSNAANNMERRYQSATVVNYYAGQCYVAVDPLLGATGDKGSQWVLLADKLQPHFDTIILIPIGVGGSSVLEWEANPWLDAGMQTPYTITHFFWHQGEADAFKLTSAQYAAALNNVIAKTKAAFPQSSFWVSIASICHGAADPNIQQAQRSVIGPGVFQGPDTDRYDVSWRWDGCHLNAEAQNLVANEWVRLLGY